MPPQQDKTEQPTPRRREELRRKGHVPISVDFVSGVNFIALFLLALFILPSLSREMMGLMGEVWTVNNTDRSRFPVDFPTYQIGLSILFKQYFLT
jgi:flagellar biosynthesis protein FlhB